MKKIILLMMAVLFFTGCANTTWINYCQRHYKKPVLSSDGQLLYYRENTVDSNPAWLKDFNGCIKYGHEARGLNYKKSIWDVEQMCYKHEDCILSVYDCLQKRGYVRVP